MAMGADMKIQISINNTKIYGELNDSAASNDLWRQLPLKLKMYPHQSREIYANMSLIHSDKTVNSYNVGDIAYWTPGDALVLYYGPGYTDNLIIMGKMTTDYSELSEITKPTMVLIERIK